MAAVIVGRRDAAAVLAVVCAAGREGCRRGRRRARAGRPACRCPPRVRALRRRGHCGCCGGAAVVDVARRRARLLRRAAVVNERRGKALAPDGVERDCAAVFAQLIEPAIDVAAGRDLCARCPCCALRRAARRPAEELPAAADVRRRRSCRGIAAVGDVRVARRCRRDIIHIVLDRAGVVGPLRIDRHGTRRVGRSIIRRSDVDLARSGRIVRTRAVRLGIPFVKMLTGGLRKAVRRGGDLHRADLADVGGHRIIGAVIAGIVVLHTGGRAHRARTAVGVVGEIDRARVDRVEVRRIAGAAGKRRPILVAEFFYACTVIVAPAQSSPAGVGRHCRDRGRLLHDDRVFRRRIGLGILRAEHLLYLCARIIGAGRVQSLIEIRFARVVRIVFSGACENIVELTVSRIESDI